MNSWTQLSWLLWWKCKAVCRSKFPWADRSWKADMWLLFHLWLLFLNRFPFSTVVSRNAISISETSAVNFELSVIDFKALMLSRLFIFQIKFRTLYTSSTDLQLFLSFNRASLSLWDRQWTSLFCNDTSPAFLLSLTDAPSTPKATSFSY